MSALGARKLSEMLQDYSSILGGAPRAEPALRGAENACFVVTAAAGTRYFLKSYGNPDPYYCSTEVTLLERLRAHGIGAPAVVRSDRSRLYESRDGHQYAMFSYLDGQRAAVRAESLSTIGKTLAKIHQLQAPEVSRPYHFDGGTFLEQVTSHSHALQPIQDVITAGLGVLPLDYGPQPRCVAHCDLHFGNLIEDKDGRFYVIDLEHAARESRVFDIARSLIFCCAWDLEYNYEMAKDILDGYHSVSSLSEFERESLFDCMIYNFSVFIFWNYLERNTLKRNEHGKHQYEELLASARVLLADGRQAFRDRAGI